MTSFPILQYPPISYSKINWILFYYANIQMHLQTDGYSIVALCKNVTLIKHYAKHIAYK